MKKWQKINFGGLYILLGNYLYLLIYNLVLNSGNFSNLWDLLSVFSMIFVFLFAPFLVFSCLAAIIASKVNKNTDWKLHALALLIISIGAVLFFNLLPLTAKH